MAKLPELVDRIEAGPDPEAVDSLLSAILDGQRISLEVDQSPVFGLLDLALSRGDALSLDTLRMADDLARDVVRYHDRLHPPEPVDETAWLWHTVAARVSSSLGHQHLAWDFAARVVSGRPDLVEHLGGVHEEEGFEAWCACCPTHFSWRHQGMRLRCVLPAPEERPHTHALASTMAVDGLTTLAAHTLGEEAVPAPALHLLADDTDLADLAELWGARPEELVGQVWRSHLEDPGEALALILAETRQDRLEMVLTELAHAVASSFGDADLSRFLAGHTLALGQALVSVANGGHVAVNESLVEALDALVGQLSEGAVEVTLSEGYPFEEPGCVLTFVRGERCFHLAISHSGSIGATPVGPV